MCAALTTVVRTTRGLSVKLPDTLAAKLAEAERAAVRATEQMAVLPLQAPPQLLKIEPAAAVAVSVTMVPLA